MSADDIARLRSLLETYGLGVLEYQDGKTSLLLTRDAEAAEEEAPTAVFAPPPPITAAHAGLFRSHHPLTAAAPLAPRTVRAGEIVAYLQTGMLLRPVVADRDGRIGAPLVADGAVTGYCTPLFAYLG